MMSENEKNTQTLVFREIVTIGEITEMIKILRKSYRGSCQTISIPDDDDRRSTHFGLFARGQLGSAELVGCLRVFHDPDIDELEGCVSALPLLKYFPDTEVVTDYLRNIKSSGAHVVEVGRMELKESYRNSGIVKFIVESIQAWGFLTQGITHALACPSTGLERLFGAQGFTRLAGTGRHRLEFQTFRTTSCLSMSKDDIPENMIDTLGRYAYAFQTFGQVRQEFEINPARQLTASGRVSQENVSHAA